MEYDIDDIQLTRNQILKLDSLITPNILSFETYEGVIKVKTQFSLSYTEMNELRSAIAGLPDEPSALERDRELFRLNELFRKSPDEARAWVNDAVTDLESAKRVIEKLTEALTILIRKSDLNQ